MTDRPRPTNPPEQPGQRVRVFHAPVAAVSLVGRVKVRPDDAEAIDARIARVVLGGGYVTK